MSIKFKVLILSPLFFMAPCGADLRSTSFLSYTPEESYPASGIDLKEIRKIPDLYFECFIAAMNDTLHIPMFYDPLVREYIEKFLIERSGQLALLTARTDTFFPIFEKYLSLYGLPSELKYLPVIESGLDIRALSPSGALGLWQFIPETGRACGLVVSGSTDERMNPEKSTRAACEYLNYLYRIFGDWQLSLVSYHAGPSVIRNAINMAGGRKNYYDIYPFLPESTQRYLPAFVASIYVLNYYKLHI